MNEQKKDVIQIAMSAEKAAGVYSNHLRVTHTPEEFIMDFAVAVPPQGVATARVITSPGHMKRILKALNQNLKKYESKFGTIREAPEPSSEIGFKTE